MSMLTYVVAVMGQNPVVVGAYTFRPESGTQRVSVREDSDQAVAIQRAATLGQLAVLDVFQVAGQVDDEFQVIPYAATVTPDWGNGRIIQISLTGNIIIAAPTSTAGDTPLLGTEIVFLLAQDGTGGRTVTWNAVFKKPADAAGTANQKARLAFNWDGTNWVGTGLTWG